MIEEERAIREAIVKEAREWIGTPYHIGSQIKGVGCDCATLILGVMINIGVFSKERLELYSADWWQHTEEERYKMQVLRRARPILEAICYRSIEALPGQIILGRAAQSRVLNHGAIITKWPLAIHSINPHVCEIDLSVDPMWAYHPIEIYDPIKERE